VGAAVEDPSPEESRLMREHGLTAEQMGFRRTLETSYRGLRSQEFAEDAETCFRATGDCCFDLEAIETRLATVGVPMETRRGGALQIWLPRLPGKEYLVAVDTAGGGMDGDFAAVQVIELESGLQCAELQERLGARDLARSAAAFRRRSPARSRARRVACLPIAPSPINSETDPGGLLAGVAARSAAGASAGTCPPVPGERADLASELVTRSANIGISSRSAIKPLRSAAVVPNCRF